MYLRIIIHPCVTYPVFDAFCLYMYTLPSQSHKGALLKAVGGCTPENCKSQQFTVATCQLNWFDVFWTLEAQNPTYVSMRRKGSVLGGTNAFTSHLKYV